MKQIIYNFLVIITCLIIFSCASKQEEKTAESEYLKAIKILKNSSFTECANKFESIAEEFPISKWAKQSEIMAAYCHYKDRSFEDVISITENFINNYPSDTDTIYMQYLRSISYYHQMPDIYRAQDSSQLALYGFKDIISRDFNSLYAQDAKKKIKIINENLAGYYMSLGRFYEKNTNYIGAINNFNYVINNYHFTRQYPESLYRIYAIYYKLGIIDEANKAKEILLKLDLNNNNKWQDRLKQNLS